MLARIASIATALCLLTVALANADPTSPGAAGQPASAATLTPAAQTPAPLNIAFDQVDRTLAGTATPPPITGFADEVQAAIDAQHASGGMNVGMGGPNLGQMAVDMIPVVGTIFSMSQAKKQMEQAKKQQQAMMDQLAGAKPPVLTRYAFYNGWTRVETASSIIITKPDQHQVVFIDVQAKTYRTYDMTAPVQTEQNTVAGAPTLTGEATANSMLSIGQADTQTVDSQPVVGYSSEAIVTLTGSSGTCQDGTFRAKKLEYLAQLPEPVAQSKEVSLDTLALPNGCSATINRQVSGTPRTERPDVRLPTRYRRARRDCRSTKTGVRQHDRSGRDDAALPRWRRTAGVARKLPATFPAREHTPAHRRRCFALRHPSRLRARQIESSCRGRLENRPIDERPGYNERPPARDSTNTHDRRRWGRKPTCRTERATLKVAPLIVYLKSVSTALNSESSSLPVGPITISA